MPQGIAQVNPNRSESITLVRLTADLLPQALSLSQEMDWPYRLEDWAFAHKLGHGLALTQAGQVVATALWWPNGDAFATAGMIIVTNAFQGRRLGARIFDALLGDLGSRTVMLNSTAEGFELYRRRGFVPVGEVHQHQGLLTLQKPASPRGLLRRAHTAEMALLARLDEEAAGRSRHSLLECLAAEARFTVIERDHHVQGFAASRRFGRGHVIGPVIASDLADAQALIDAAAADLQGAFVRVDTMAELQLTPWLEARGLLKVSAATNMVLGAPPWPSGSGRLFALCSQSLG